MNVTVADICWCICLVWISYPLFFCIFQTVSVGRRRFSANFQLVFRLIKFLIFVTFASILITLIALPHMTVQDIIVCILAFMPTGWGLLLVGEDILPANLSRISSAIFSLFFHIMNYMLLWASDCTSLSRSRAMGWALGIHPCTCPRLWNHNGPAPVYPNCLFGLVPICVWVPNPNAI